MTDRNRELVLFHIYIYIIFFPNKKHAWTLLYLLSLSLSIYIYMIDSNTQSTMTVTSA